MINKKMPETHKKNRGSFDTGKAYSLFQSVVPQSPGPSRVPPHRKHASLNFRSPPKWPATNIPSHHNILRSFIHPPTDNHMIFYPLKFF